MKEIFASDFTYLIPNHNYCTHQFKIRLSEDTSLVPRITNYVYIFTLPVHVIQPLHELLLSNLFQYLIF